MVGLAQVLPRIAGPPPPPPLESFPEERALSEEKAISQRLVLA